MHRHGIRNIWTDTITAETKSEARGQTLARFASSKSKLAIVTSVRILNEGIDVLAFSADLGQPDESDINNVKKRMGARRRSTRTCAHIFHAMRTPS